MLCIDRTLLGLVEKSAKSSHALTIEGQRIFNLPYKKRLLELAKKMLQYRVFSRCLDFALKNAALPDSDTVAAWILEDKWPMNSTTAHRRASSVIGWTRWLINLTNNNWDLRLSVEKPPDGSRELCDKSGVLINRQLNYRKEQPMKPFARINLSSAALRRGILVSSLALVAIVAGWFGKDDTAEFKVGDSETEIIARIPEETKAIACFHKFSLRAGGDDWRVFDSGFSYANGEKGMLLVFNNGKLFNIVKDCDSDGRNSYYERVGVTYDHQEYDYGPPLDYAKMVLGQNTQENCKEWKMRFSSYDKEAHYNWGLAIVALPFAIVDKLTSSHDRSNQTSADWRYDAYDSAAIGLGETRTEVERRLGKSVDTDANGICTYIGDRTRPSKFVVLVKYDTDSCVEAVFNNAFRSRLLMKRVEVK